MVLQKGELFDSDFLRGDEQLLQSRKQPETREGPPSRSMNRSNSFSLESFEFTGSIVPIPSYLMVRSEFYNGAISSWVNILSLYWLEALYFLFDEQILLMMNPYWCFITQIFYEMTHRPYILEFYIIHILFLSFFHPSIYPYPFFFISIDNLEADFLMKKYFSW